MKDHNKSFVIVLIVLVGIFVAITVNALIRAKSWTITKPWDTHGFYCGFDNSKLVVKDAPNDFVKPNLVDYPYLYFDAKNISRQICVSKCPTEKGLPGLFDKIHIGQNRIGSYLDNKTYNAKYYPGARKVYKYKTRLVLNRCIPDLTIGGYMDLASSYSEDFEQISKIIPKYKATIDDLLKNKYMYLVSCAITLIIGFVWIMIQHDIVGYVIKFFVVLVPISLIGVGLFLFSPVVIMSPMISLFLLFYSQLKIIAVIVWVIAALIIWFLVCIWRKLNLAISLINIAADAFYYNFTTIIFRILSTFIFILVSSIVLVSSVALYSIYEFKVSDE